jgi:hypothetical protein
MKIGILGSGVVGKALDTCFQAFEIVSQKGVF